ncbi:MAG: hypothetical protein ACOVJ6_03245, partial [Pirellulales bacterium]
MTAADLFHSLIHLAHSRQLRRSAARHVARTLRRDPNRFTPEALEARAMMTATVGDLAGATLVTQSAVVSTIATPRTVTVTWAWNENKTINDFNPATDKLALDWFSGSELRLTEQSGSAVLAIPAMQQSYRLAGVPLARLTAANFTCKDPTATTYIGGVLAAAKTVTPTPTPTPTPT